MSGNSKEERKLNEEEKRQAILAGQKVLEAARRDKTVAPSSGTGRRWPGSWPMRTGRWAEPGQEDLVAIPAKSRLPVVVNLSQRQASLIWIVSLLVAPAAILVVGIAIWVRRRKL